VLRISFAHYIVKALSEELSHIPAFLANSSKNVGWKLLRLEALLVRRPLYDPVFYSSFRSSGQHTGS